MDYSVKMVFKDEDKVKPYYLPQGYRFRFYRQGDESLWAKVETLAGEFASEEKALERFKKEFGDYTQELESRLLFIETDDKEVVGTIMAWYGQLRYENEGRIHWVGIVPSHQGKGLAKPLLYKALKILIAKHNHIYLTTQYSSIAGINLYKQFGFVEYEDEDTHPDAWKIINQELDALNKNR